MTPEERAERIVERHCTIDGIQDEIAAAIRDAVEEEREACAVEAENCGCMRGDAAETAQRIRDRGKP